MIRLFFVLALILMAFWGLRKVLDLPPETLSKILKKSALVGLPLVFIYLAAIGKLNGLFALAGVFVAFMLRVFPQLMRYLPQLHGLWMAFNQHKKTSSKTNNSSSAKAGMDKEEAYSILGLTSKASVEEITKAHRQLMQKMHPDRGGSDYIAAKINLAKKVLLQGK